MAGAPVEVVTNSFLIKSLPTRTYFQYDVFKPEDPKPQKRQRLMHALQVTVYPQVFTPRAVYDGGRLLYSHKVIETGVYRVHGSNQNASKDAPGWYDITITRTAGQPIIPSNVNKLMVQGQATPETATATNLLQLLLSQNKNQDSPNTGKAYFVPEGKQDLRGMASVRPSIGRMLVTVDTTVAAMYMPGPLPQVCMALLNVREARRLAIRDTNHEDFRKIQRHLKNRLILVKTPDGRPPRTKTVRDLVPGPVGRYEFTGSNGQTTTIGDHFRNVYNLPLQFPDTIGVVTSGKGAPFKVVFPLEMCNLLPGQLYKKKLPPDATATVVSFAAMPPADRLRIITAGGGNQQRSPVQDYQHSEYLVDAGMQIDQTPTTIRGRLLNVPPLLYKDKQVTARDGAWNVLGARFYAPRQMLLWGVINFDPHRIDQRVVQKTSEDLLRCCNQLDVAPPRAIRTGNGHDVEGSLRNLCNELAGGDVTKVDMVVVLLPAKADEIRTRVKYSCDVKLGVRSQCLREPKLQRANNQYFNSELNARLGGLNSLVDSPVFAELKSKPFMFFGADVAHPGPGANRPSVASLVWSHDMYGAAYCATTRVQLPRTEIMTDLKEMMEMAVRMFGQKHKAAPANIVFFRDGVSEGEFSTVKDIEIGQINEALDNVWTTVKIPSPKPKVSFVVVGKRHHVSFFPPNRQDRVGDKTGNCRAGLCVAAGLENPQFPDYYLQSHAAIKGSMSSGLHSHFSQLILQELSFALCHIYAKATRSVSIPAPVYYADLACARGKFHFDPSADMDIEGSTTSGGKEGDVFQLDPWQNAFEPVNDSIKGSMFFLNTTNCCAFWKLLRMNMY
ncbi:argonaute-like protein [Mycena olivaceomarginata]|nr:argonaute-like protein [Mycena olivaceomarginata]